VCSTAIGTPAPVHLDSHNSRFHPHSSLVLPEPVRPTEKFGAAERNDALGSSANGNFVHGTHRLELQGFSQVEVHQNQLSLPHTPGGDEMERQGRTSGLSVSQVSVGSCVCGCGGGACIPQREYDRQKTDPLLRHVSQEVILFSVNGKCGFPLENALKERYTGLDRRDNKILVDSKSSISIRLEVRPFMSTWSDDGLKSCSQWLPYEGWSAPVSTSTLISLRGY